MYSDDLAYIQHFGFADFATAASPGLLSILRAAFITRGHIVDLGCGDGTWLRALTRHGYRATGIEQSRHLVRYARASAPKAVVKHGAVHSTSFPQCDAITAIGEVLSYRLAHRSSPRSLPRIFQRAYQALRPGGVFVFDVIVAGPPFSYFTWRTGSTWAVLAHVTEKNETLTRQIVTFRKGRGGYRRSSERHVLTVFAVRAIVGELRKAGFIVRTTRSYGRFALPVRRLGFIARKP